MYQLEHTEDREDQGGRILEIPGEELLARSGYPEGPSASRGHSDGGAPGPHL